LQNVTLRHFLSNNKESLKRSQDNVVFPRGRSCLRLTRNLICLDNKRSTKLRRANAGRISHHGRLIIQIQLRIECNYERKPPTPPPLTNIIILLHPLRGKPHRPRQEVEREMRLISSCHRQTTIRKPTILPLSDALRATPPPDPRHTLIAYQSVYATYWHLRLNPTFLRGIFIAGFCASYWIFPKHNRCRRDSGFYICWRVESSKYLL